MTPAMPQTFAITDYGVAYDFVVAYGSKQARSGLGMARNERVVTLANAILQRIEARDVSEAARKLRSINARKGKGLMIHAIRCDRCNKTLTALESIAAGVGPTCQAA